MIFLGEGKHPACERVFLESGRDEPMFSVQLKACMPCALCSIIIKSKSGIQYSPNSDRLMRRLFKIHNEPSRQIKLAIYIWYRLFNYNLVNLQSKSNPTQNDSVNL